MNCSYTTIPITDIPDVTNWNLSGTTLTITITVTTPMTIMIVTTSRIA